MRCMCAFPILYHILIMHLCQDLRKSFIIRRIKKNFLILLLARAIDRARSPFIPGLKRQRGFLSNQINQEDNRSLLFNYVCSKHYDIKKINIKINTEKTRTLLLSFKDINKKYNNILPKNIQLLIMQFLKEPFCIQLPGFHKRNTKEIIEKYAL